MFFSPLRYPGGKNKLAKFIAMICFENDINGHYIEPYAGGAAVALYLLINDKVSKITINDKDRSIYAFWYSVLNHTTKFCNSINNTEINVKNWKKFKEVQKNKETADLFTLGFSTFFLNRTNVSGIIDGGIIGGLKQVGNYKINCRFNKKTLIERIKKIASCKDKIELYNLDALDLIKRINKECRSSNKIFYFDPPYYLKGESLYLNCYKPDDHKQVSEEIIKIKNAKWIVSYDNTTEIKKLYSNCQKIEYSFFHTAREAKIGKEILFFCDKLKVPVVPDPTRLVENDYE